MLNNICKRNKKQEATHKFYKITVKNAGDPSVSAPSPYESREPQGAAAPSPQSGKKTGSRTLPIQLSHPLRQKV
jgi:hypothetical protein